MSVVVLILVATVGRALAEEPQPAAAAPPSGWSWAAAVGSASKVWARVSSRGDLSTAVAKGSSVAVDAGARVAAGAWDHVPSRAAVADYATERGSNLLASGKGAASGVADLAKSDAAYLLETWRAVPRHQQMEDSALAYMIVFSTVKGSARVCKALAKLNPATAAMTPAVGIACAYAGWWTARNITRSTFRYFGRTVDEETLGRINDEALDEETYGVSKLVHLEALKHKKFAVVVRELWKVAPERLDTGGTVAAVFSPAFATGMPGEVQGSPTIPASQEVRAPALPSPGSP